MENKNEKGVVEKVIDHLKENTAEIHEANKRKLNVQKEAFKERHAEATAPVPPFKEKLELEKEAFRQRHAEATAPNPGLEKVKQAEGVKAKVKTIVDNIVEGAKENTEKERARRAKILKDSNPKT